MTRERQSFIEMEIKQLKKSFKNLEGYLDEFANYGGLKASRNRKIFTIILCCDGGQPKQVFGFLP